MRHQQRDPLTQQTARTLRETRDDPSNWFEAVEHDDLATMQRLVTPAVIATCAAAVLAILAALAVALFT